MAVEGVARWDSLELGELPKALRELREAAVLVGEALGEWRSVEGRLSSALFGVMEGRVVEVRDGYVVEWMDLRTCDGLELRLLEPLCGCGLVAVSPVKPGELRVGGSGALGWSFTIA